MWNYVVTAAKPSAVTHSLVANFTSAGCQNLILGKCTRFEIFVLTSEGLVAKHAINMYGRISVIEAFRPPGEDKDLLFISTERFKFCVIAYDEETGEIVTRAKGDIKDHIGRPTETGQLGIIDPKCQVIGLHIYDGLFKVIPIDTKGQLKEAFNIRLEELQVLDIKFLQDATAKPTIVLLYQDTKSARHVKTYEINLVEKDFGEGPWNQANVERSAAMLIPVPRPFGGSLLVGEQTISYHNGQVNKSIAMKTTIMKAYGKIDANGTRFLLGDHVGQLYVLVLVHAEDKIVGLKLEPLGETSIPSSITYLDNAVVYIGSTYGDSQLVKLHENKDENGNYIEVLETFANLGPIVDFCVVDLERQGQGQVVTCSGAFKDGSLRIIRNGIGINEHASIELSGIKGMWSLRESFDTEFDKFLVMSFIGETRVMGIADEEVGEVEIDGFADGQTLFCGNMCGNYFVQVTETAVRLISSESLQLLNEWTPPADKRINVATGSATQVLVATGGGNLVYLEIVDDKLVEKGHTQLEHEIACLDMTPVGDDPLRATVCAVGMWTDISVRILKLPTFEMLSKDNLGGEVIPRSLLFVSFEGIYYLLCALGDGHLFNFVLNLSTGGLSDRKKISLGTQPIDLNTFRSKSATHVFAASDRPTVIYSSNQKILYSNVNLKEVNRICPFNSESFPDSLAIAMENSLKIGTIDDIQKLHIRTIHLGEDPRRICHQEATSTFAVCTMKYFLDSHNNEIETDYVKLLDDQTFETMHQFELERYECICSVVSCKLAEDPTPYYIVGTAHAIPTEAEPTRGRLLVFQVKDGKLDQVSEKEVKGAVYSLNSFNGKLLAGVNSKVQLFKWTTQEDGTKDLTVECGHHGHILALYVQSRGDFIIVGDLMKSMQLLLYKPVDGSIEEIARDYNANWMTAVDILDDDTFIGAENSFNIFTVKKNSDAATDEERGKLEVCGEYHLGEFVNKFCKGSLVMRMAEGEGPAVPTLLFGTVNGVVGVVASLPEEEYNFFLKVQTGITKVVRCVGGLDHEEWRSFCNDRRTAKASNFLDGDLIESFLDLKPAKMEEVVKEAKLTVSVEELSKRIEELTRLH